jgi:flagellar motor switch protein FliG
MASPPAPTGSELVASSSQADSEQLPGARKAAVLMAALGSERAASVMQQMQEDEIESISIEMARLSSVGSQATESVFTELMAVAAEGTPARGGVDFAREVIERALGPERAVEVLAKLSTVVETRPFEFLRRSSPSQIAGILRAESPQTAALVLANLNSNLAAQVLADLPESGQPDIAHRIARMGEASPSVIRQVEELIRRRLSAAVQREYASAGGAKALAAILNHADRSTERNVLDRLAATDQELAEEVRGMLFVFEDLVKLDERAIQQVLREVDQKDLVLALRGASESLTEVVLTNMSERGAAMLKEEMEIQQPQRKRDVEQAQTRIVATVRKLEEAGTIAISSEEGDEESEAVV